MNRKKHLPFLSDLSTHSFRDLAKARGISVDTLKRQIKERKEEELVRKAKTALQPMSAGWNPRAGNRKRVK